MSSSIVDRFNGFTGENCVDLPSMFACLDKMPNGNEVLSLISQAAFAHTDQNFVENKQNWGWTGENAEAQRVLDIQNQEANTPKVTSEITVPNTAPMGPLTRRLLARNKTSN